MAIGARAPTPLSPSPSPEPPAGAARPATSSNVEDRGVQPDDPNERARKQLETATRGAVDALYQLAVCAAHVNEGQEGVVGSKINSVVEALANISACGASPELTSMIPEDVLTIIDQGRNPDFHTKTFVNRLTADNQQMAAMTTALDAYHDRLSASLSEAFPELAGPIAELQDDERGLPRPQLQQGMEQGHAGSEMKVNGAT